MGNQELENTNPQKNIIRIKKDKDNPYVMINKECLCNPNLSWKAKGLLAYLLSLPNDWTIYLSHLKNVGKDGRDGTAAGLIELEKFGYVTRSVARGNHGKYIGIETIVHEKPIIQTSKDAGLNKNSPATEKPDTDNPDPENTSLLNTDLNDKNSNNREIYISKEKDKKERKKKEKKPKREARVMTYMQEDFIVPDEWITWVVGEYGCNEKYAKEQSTMFVNYYSATDTQYSDWRKTWQNWMKRNQSYKNQSHNFNQSSEKGSERPTEASKEKREYRTREGVDKIICDEFRRVYGNDIFYTWIENHNVSFYQENEDERVECRTPSYFVWGYINDNFLSKYAFSDLGYQYRSTIDESLKHPPKDSPKKLHWLDVKMQNIAKENSQKAYELIINNNIKFRETERKGMLNMYGCNEEVWDKVYNILNPIVQDFHDLKIAIGRPHL